MALLSWRALEDELARLRPVFWWRDDDAMQPTAALRELLALSQAADVPLALAVVPLGAQPELFDGLRADVLMHGSDHRNRAAPGEKKTEFSAAEPQEEALRRLRGARERLAALAGDRFLPVLAPPWNRFPRAWVTRLPEIGLHGLSAFGRRGDAVPGVREIHTHVDIIDWHGTRAFVGEEAALAAVLKQLANGEQPIGVLTHHAVHDAAAWAFLEQLFERTRRHGARWMEARSLFPASA